MLLSKQTIEIAAIAEYLTNKRLLSLRIPSVPLGNEREIVSVTKEFAWVRKPIGRGGIEYAYENVPLNRFTFETLNQIYKSMNPFATREEIPMPEDLTKLFKKV